MREYKPSAAGWWASGFSCGVLLMYFAGVIGS